MFICGHSGMGRGQETQAIPQLSGLKPHMVPLLIAFDSAAADTQQGLVHAGSWAQFVLTAYPSWMLELSGGMKYSWWQQKRTADTCSPHPP